MAKSVAKNVHVLIAITKQKKLDIYAKFIIINYINQIMPKIHFLETFIYIYKHIKLQNQKMNQEMISQPQQKTVQNKSQQVQHNMTGSIQPTHKQGTSSHILSSHTNYTNQETGDVGENKLQVNQTRVSQEDPSKVQTLTPQQIQLGKQIVQQIIKQETIKTTQISIQAGEDKKLQMLLNTEQTYSPQSFVVHQKTQNSTQSQSSQAKNGGNEDPSNNADSKQNVTNQVEIQVGVSLLDEPQKAINKAKKQRILSDQQNYLKYVEDHKINSQNVKSVFDHIFEQIQKNKMEVYLCYGFLKQYFQKYSSFCKDFYEKCEKVPKQQKIQQPNKYLNIGEQLKAGYVQLAGFKKQTGVNYKNMYEYINTKVLKDLDQLYNNYINQMNQAQGLVNKKKKNCIKVQQQFRKQCWKVQKMFNRVKEGKKQEDDFFVELCKVIVLQRQYRQQSLMQWGRQVMQLRKKFIDLSQSCMVNIQLLLNNFKNQSNSLYGIQSKKYDTIRKSRDQLIQKTQFKKLITLTDGDYIKYVIQSTLKKETPEITNKVFQQFMTFPQFSPIIAMPQELVKNLIVKVFTLKDTTQQLVNTVSGNLVLYSKKSHQCLQKMPIRQIKAANPSNDGVIQIEERVPGIIFNSKRKTTVEFKDSDRAEQLLCFLSLEQSITSNFSSEVPKPN